MNRPLCCFECVQSEIYNNLEDLEAHVASDHLNMFPYECEKCKWAKFPTEFALVSHNLTDHGVTEFSIRYRYTPELIAKRKELTEKVDRSIAMSRSDAVSSTEDPRVKVESTTATATATPIQSCCSPSLYMDSSAMNSYQAFLDEALQRHEEEKIPGVEGTSAGTKGAPLGKIKVKQQIMCSLCGDVVSKQRSSMVYHANTRHGKYELYECGYCHRKWQTIAKSDVIKHIRSHHPSVDGVVDSEKVIDYRKNLGNKLKEITEQCFPERKKKRIGYTDVLP